MIGSLCSSELDIFADASPVELRPSIARVSLTASALAIIYSGHGRDNLSIQERPWFDITAQR